MEPLLTVHETVSLYAGYYRRPRDVDETIALVGLTAEASVRAGRLSGGQQRRLDVAIALIGDAELLFLDEPTTGVDPSARRQTWRVITSLQELGKTVFLTTHYMDEAQFLADRVAIIRDGLIVAEGSPDELGGRSERSSKFGSRFPPGVGVDALPQGIGDLELEPPSSVILASDDATRSLNALTGWAIERGVELHSLEVTRPSLEDMYLELTEGVAA
jgi:ABC-2 type transport system ATP-binding protein